jgi:quercetin dioxygenase-like cupin family protein
MTNLTKPALFNLCKPEPSTGEHINALFSSPGLQLKKIVLKAKQALPLHSSPGEVVVCCLSGWVDFHAGDQEYALHGGTVIHLPPGMEHALCANEDSVLLLLQLSH